MNEDQITAELTPLLAELGLELEAIEVHPAGRRQVLRIVVDGDGLDGTGPGLDELARATRAVSAAMDESDSTGAAPYTLELSSRGVHRPLTDEKHWRRNSGRLVKINMADATEPITGRITAHTAEGVTIDVGGTPRGSVGGTPRKNAGGTSAEDTTAELREIAYADMTKALVQVEFNRKKAVPLDVDPDLAEHEDENDGETAENEEN